MNDFVLLMGGVAVLALIVPACLIGLWLVEKIAIGILRIWRKLLKVVTDVAFYLTMLAWYVYSGGRDDE